MSLNAALFKSLVVKSRVAHEDTSQKMKTFLCEINGYGTLDAFFVEDEVDL